MREWLVARRGRVCKPAADEPTSVLRPSRSTTFGEKRVKEKRRKGLLAAQAASAIDQAQAQAMHAMGAAKVCMPERRKLAWRPLKHKPMWRCKQRMRKRTSADGQIGTVQPDPELSIREGLQLCIWDFSHGFQIPQRL